MEKDKEIHRDYTFVKEGLSAFKSRNEEGV